MADIEKITKVNISLQPSGISEVGFSTVLVMGAHVNTLNRVETYTNIDAMLDDGFQSTDKLYLALRDGFSQIPRPSLIKVGRMQVDVAKIGVKTVANNTLYSLIVKFKDVNFNVITKTYEFTSATSATATTIASGLQALITADVADIPVTASASLGVITLTNKVLGTAFQVIPSSNLTITEANTSELPDVALAAINSEDSDWYGLCTVFRDQESILNAAAWIEAQLKVYVATTGEAGAIDNASVTDTAFKLKQNNYFRTGIFYHTDVNDFADVAAITKWFSKQVGRDKIANQQLGGVSYDALTSTQSQAILNKNGSTFEPIRNLSITLGGKVAAGEWLDIIRGRDWLEEQIKLEVFRLQIQPTKLGYTDNDIQKIAARVAKVLDRATVNGFLAPDEYIEDQFGEITGVNPGYVLTVPLASSVSTNDRANRVFKPAQMFKARVAGAIHLVEINGEIGVEII